MGILRRIKDTRRTESNHQREQFTRVKLYGVPVLSEAPGVQTYVTFGMKIRGKSHLTTARSTKRSAGMQTKEREAIEGVPYLLFDIRR